MTIIPFVHGVVLLSTGFMLWKRSAEPLRKFFWPAFLLKMAAGIGIGLLYTFYYTGGDTFNYFHDGITLAGFARRDATGYLAFMWDTDAGAPIWRDLVFNDPRALFLSKVVSVAGLLTGSNYWVIACYFSLSSFAAAWYLVSITHRYNGKLAGAAVVAFLFFPSVVFWSSGILKESLAMAALYFSGAVLLKRWGHQSITVGEWLVVPLCIWILWMLKYYYVAIFLPAAITALVVQRAEQRFVWLSPVWGLVVWVAVFMIPLSVASMIHPNFYPERFFGVIVSNYDTFAALSGPEDRIDYAGLEASAGSILWHSPKALISALFRPFPWEATNVFQGLTAVENCILLVLLVMSIPRWGDAWQDKDRVLVFSLIVYIVLLGIFLALSTPNFGTLSRYRVGFLPFLVFLVACGNKFFERLQRRRV